MTKVGIGQLKYAQTKSGKDTAGKSAAIPSPTRPLNGSAPRKSNKEETKEGQLAVDIFQTEDKMIIVCPIAGVNKSDIKVAIQDDVLTIRGERKTIDHITEKQPLVRELFWGSFSRSIVLPDHIDRKNINAQVHEHMLVITIPKTEDFKTRIIHINEIE